MNSEVKAKWIEALRSGEYQQGRHALRADDRFCCLGVLCNLYIEETSQAEWKTSEDKVDNSSRYSFVEEGRDSITGYLPASVIEWAGLLFENPRVEVEGSFDCTFETTLACLNDEGKDFELIANIIEHQL